MKELSVRASGVEVQVLSFPDRLAEALGPRETAPPEINPVARHEAVRWINGLPRRARSPEWFVPPAASSSQREVALDAFIGGVDRAGASDAELKLMRLLEDRRALRSTMLAAIARLGLSERER